MFLVVFALGSSSRSCDFTAYLRTRSCDFKAHVCTGMILSSYKSFVNPLFKLMSIKLRLHYVYTSQDDKITSDALSRCQKNQKNKY